MRCLRFGLQREFPLYLNGELGPAGVKRIEDHLLDCGSCRTRLAHLRNGHWLANQLPRFTPARDRWEDIEAAIGALESETAKPRPARARWRELALKPGFALATISVIALIGAVLLASGALSPAREGAGLVADALDLTEFHTVTIADIERNQKPHVVAEGYVSEVSANDDEGDLKFKLVDDLGQPGAFIVCEIIDPIRLKAPAVGSRVRVYGVSRYDGQADHNWYEVHPVLNIELVHR